ncbi:phnA protein [Gammaproteobacteria bacterium 45_16_T64]|nr:phnA protein [Gammaproteobacteria bacterium 45_16_T64]
MSKAKEKHAERLRALSLLGKDLTRRCRSHCELCSASGVKLAPFEVAPIQDIPDTEHAIFICDVCVEQLKTTKYIDVDHWRCLNTSVWSEIPVVQVAAVRMLKRLADKTEWSADLYDQLYLEPDVLEWIENDAE